MTYVVTYIDIRPNSANQAIVLIEDYCKHSSAEEGNAGIKVLQETNRRNRFVIIEAWKDESSFQTHESAAHTVHFRTSLRTIYKSPDDQRVHHAFSVGRAGSGTFAVVTHVDVPPPRKDETELLLRDLAEKGRNDKGNLRYDVFQQNAPRLNHFTVFSIWSDENAFGAHEMQPHTRQFRETLGPMLGAPYDDRLYRPLN